MNLAGVKVDFLSRRRRDATNRCPVEARGGGGGGGGGCGGEGRPQGPDLEDPGDGVVGASGLWEQRVVGVGGRGIRRRHAPPAPGGGGSPQIQCSR